MTFRSRLCQGVVVMVVAAALRAQVHLQLTSVTALPETPRLTLELLAHGGGPVTELNVNLSFPPADLRFVEVYPAGDITPEQVSSLTVTADPERGTVRLEIVFVEPVTFAAEPAPAFALVWRLGGGMEPGETYAVGFSVPPVATVAGVPEEATAEGAVITISTENVLIMGDGWGYPGQRAIPVELKTSNADPLMGMQVSGSFDPDSLHLAEVSLQNTMTEALECEFFQPVIDNDLGTFVVGILLDNSPPVDLAKRYAVTGYRQRVARFYFDVREDAPPDQDVPLLLIDDLSRTPPIKNRVVVDHESVAPQTIDGTFRVGHVPVFLRGDANSDGTVDVADPVMICLHLFKERDIDCRKAADADDDGEVRLNDVQYILSYLFLRGRTIPPPFPVPGQDPRPDDLSCEGL